MGGKGKGKGKKGAKGKAGDDSRRVREAQPAPVVPQDIPPLSIARCRPKPLLPEWNADSIEDAEWEDDFQSALPTLPGFVQDEDVTWRRPADFVSPPAATEEEPEPEPVIEVVKPLPAPKPKPGEVVEAEEPDPKGKKGKKAAKKPAAKGKKGKAEDVPPMILPKELATPVLPGFGVHGSSAHGVQDMFAATLRTIASFGANALPGQFLWEAIYPKGPDTRPAYSPGGRYMVRVYWAGAWRQVVVDDRLPFDAEGNRLFVGSATIGELWPSLLYKAWLQLTQGIPGAASDASLMFYTFCGWLPQAVPTTLGKTAWPLLTAVVPYNEPTPAEIKAAQAKSEELAWARWHRKQAREAERQRRLAAGESDDSDDSEEEDTDLMLDQDLEDILENPFAAPQTPFVLALQCTASEPITFDDAGAQTLQPGGVYGIAAIRDTTGVQKVLLTGNGKATETPRQPSLADAKEGKDDGEKEEEQEGKGGDAEAKEGGSADEAKDAEPAEPAAPAIVPDKPFTAYDMWVPLADLEQYFGAGLLVLHHPGKGFGTAELHAHWLQPGQGEYGSDVPAEDDAKAKKGKDKGKAKKGKGKAEPEADSVEPVTERKIALPRKSIWVDGGASGASLLVVCWRDAQEPVAPASANVTDGPVAAFAAPAILTVDEDTSYHTLIPNDASGREAPEDNLYGSEYLPQSQRLRFKTPRIASELLSVPPGKHMYSVDVNAPTGYCVHTFVTAPVTPYSESEETQYDENDGKQAEEEGKDGGEAGAGAGAGAAADAAAAAEAEVKAAEAAEPEQAVFVGEWHELLAQHTRGVVQVLPGTSPAAAADEWKVMFRYTVKPTVPDEETSDGSAIVWVNLHLWHPDVAPFVRLFTIDNDSGVVDAHAMHFSGAIPLRPNEGGYTLMATLCRRSAPLPAGPFFLSVLSTVELEPLTPAAEALADLAMFADESEPAVSFRGVYTPNKEFLLFRDLVRLGQPSAAVSMRLAASVPGAWLRLEALNPVTGSVVARTYGRGYATLIALPPGGASGEPIEEAAPEDASELDQKLYSIDVEQVNEANLLLQAFVEHRRWQPWESLKSHLPWTSARPLNGPDPDDAIGKDAEEKKGDDGEDAGPAAKYPLAWQLSVQATTGGFKMWRDQRVALKQQALIDSWEEADEGRTGRAAAQAFRIQQLMAGCDPSEVKEFEPAEEAAGGKAKGKKGAAKGKPKPKAKGKGKGAEDEEAAAAAAAALKAARDDAWVAAGKQRADLDEAGRVEEAGDNVQVVNWLIVHDGEQQDPVIQPWQLAEGLARGKQLIEESDGADETGYAPSGEAAVDVEVAYVTAMRTAREVQALSRATALRHQQHVMANWRADTDKSYELDWKVRAEFKEKREAELLQRLKEENEARAKTFVDLEAAVEAAQEAAAAQ